MLADSSSAAASRHLARVEEAVKRLERRERHLRLDVRIATLHRLLRRFSEAIGELIRMTANRIVERADGVRIVPIP
jgi:hypothetical protein